jgi:hypothetical protein
MSLKPNRNELLDAIALRICTALTEHANSLLRRKDELDKEVKRLREERASKQLDLDRFNPIIQELEEAINGVLRKHNCSAATVSLWGDTHTNDRDVRPVFNFGVSKGKYVRKRATKVIDRKIKDRQIELETASSDWSKASEQAARWDTRRFGPDGVRAIRARIMSDVMENEPALVKEIDKAAAHVVKNLGLEDELVEQATSEFEAAVRAKSK